MGRNVVSDASMSRSDTRARHRHAPRKNIFEIMRSRLTGFARLPAPAGTSDQSSFTFSSTLHGMGASKEGGGELKSKYSSATEV